MPAGSHRTGADLQRGDKFEASEGLRVIAMRMMSNRTAIAATKQAIRTDNVRALQCERAEDDVNHQQRRLRSQPRRLKRILMRSDGKPYTGRQQEGINSVGRVPAPAHLFDRDH